MKHIETITTKLNIVLDVFQCDCGANVAFSSGRFLEYELYCPSCEQEQSVQSNTSVSQNETKDTLK